jgi:tRNA-splicing ligase RtcB (3'-phosphate/5'-hydroxy nucleic acid ligase)
VPIQTVIAPAGGRVPVKVWTDDIEETARVQLENLSRLPFVLKHVAVMPDVHWGNGTSVGTVIPTIKAIIPAAVGVDLGCGMMALKLNLTASELPDSLAPLRSAIEAAIPHGRTANGGQSDRGAWGDVPDHVAAAFVQSKDARYASMDEKHPTLLKRVNSVHHLGTLGTGNHFIELCVDKESNVWLMLHSGSRGIGNRIGSYFIDKAKEEMERWHIDLPDPNLAYLPEGSQYFADYVSAIGWAQDFARTNREIMMTAALKAVQQFIPHAVGEVEAVNCHHNYVSLENHYDRNVYVTRKGAVRARAGELGIIPGSMGARSFIVRGLGNPESFCSCSHGAGRKMSRGAAKKLFSVADLEAATMGVECRKDADVIDEIPGAYKDIDVVMANQSDLVEVVAELKQVLCVKG